MPHISCKCRKHPILRLSADSPNERSHPAPVASIQAACSAQSHRLDELRAPVRAYKSIPSPSTQNYFSPKFHNRPYLSVGSECPVLWWPGRKDMKVSTFRDGQNRIVGTTTTDSNVDTVAHDRRSNILGRSSQTLTTSVVRTNGSSATTQPMPTSC